MRTIDSLMLMVLGLATVEAATAETVRLNEGEQARAGVVLGAVQERTFGDQIRVVGRAVRAPEATTSVMTVLDGRVVEMLVAPGDVVKVGQPLVRLHSHDLHRLRGELLERREELRLAESSLQAGEKLLELEGISRVELERRGQVVLAARVAFDNSQEELHEVGYSESEIEQLMDSADFRPILTVRSPTRGVVLRLEAQVHAWVMAYEPLMLIGDPQQLELELQLPPYEAGSIAEGDLVEFVPMGRREMWGLAQVVTKVPEVDAMTRTVMVRARISHGAELLLPGVFVEGNLIHGDASQSPSVPESAVTRIEASDYVFVSLDSQTFEARPVEVGRFNGSHYEILNGVEVGEQVAERGVFLLKSALLRAAEEGD
jgi:cobalt-zinc-cadmium efflux system membrane fusion protein